MRKRRVPVYGARRHHIKKTILKGPVAEEQMQKEAVGAIVQAKSTGVAVLLTVFFGGLGLLYASITGGIIVSVLQGLALLIILVPVVGLIGVPVALLLQLVAVVWGVVAVGRHNERLVSKVQ